MRQVVYSLSSGGAQVVDVPRPTIGRGEILVRNLASAVSVGTERAGMATSEMSFLEKARARPDQVKAVLRQVAQDGLGATARRVRNKLGDYVAPGYSSAGIIEEVGADCRTFEVGQPVACAGAGYAVHAEYVRVPRNLVAPVPEGVSFEAASLTTVAAIALQGVRQAEVALGDTVAVIGLGLLGQITVQLLVASGTRPIGVDLAPDRVELAARHGARAVLRSHDVEGLVSSMTRGRGVDAVIIAAATSSNDPIQLAGTLCRDRAKVVVVGDVPMNIPRSPFYEKEVDVRLSRSYGPGRYDPQYEEGGHDYPVGYVRWTEQRNLDEVLRLLATGGLDMEDLITHRFPLEQAPDAYRLISPQSQEVPPPLGVVFGYPSEPKPEPPRIEITPGLSSVDGAVAVGLIGAGSFTRDVLLPAFKSAGAHFIGVTSRGGVNARRVAEMESFRYASEGPEQILGDGQVDAVVIATPHNQHAEQTVAALRARKAVFVEKPLALDDSSLKAVMEAAAMGPSLMVGFNRRFSPATGLLMEWLDGVEGSRVIQIRVNAGAIPRKHWIQDPEIGGGRLLGEVCHFIDLAGFLAGSRPTLVQTHGVGKDDPNADLQDDLSLVIQFENGSLATIVYTARGAKQSGKERVEVFAGGGSGTIDDFREADTWTGKGHRRWKGRQDKGHGAEVSAFLESLRSGTPPPIPLSSLESTTLTTLRALDSLRSGQPEPVIWRLEPAPPEEGA